MIGAIVGNILLFGFIIFLGYCLSLLVAPVRSKPRDPPLVIPPSPYYAASSYLEPDPCGCTNGAYPSHYSPGYHGAMEPRYKPCPSCNGEPRFRSVPVPGNLPPEDLVLPQSQVQWRIGFEPNRKLSRPEQEQKVAVYYPIWNLPGWYLDGTGPDGWGSGPPTTRRYWDGQRWTNKTR